MLLVERVVLDYSFELGARFPRAASESTRPGHFDCSINF
jgi:hypothetical protein